MIFDAEEFDAYVHAHVPNPERLIPSDSMLLEMIPILEKITEWCAETHPVMNQALKDYLATKGIEEENFRFDLKGSINRTFIMAAFMSMCKHYGSMTDEELVSATNGAYDSFRRRFPQTNTEVRH